MFRGHPAYAWPALYVASLVFDCDVTVGGAFVQPTVTSQQDVFGGEGGSDADGDEDEVDASDI